MVLWQFTFPSRSKKTYVTETQIANKFVFLDFHLAPLCNFYGFCDAAHTKSRLGHPWVIRMHVSQSLIACCSWKKLMETNV